MGRSVANSSRKDRLSTWKKGTREGGEEGRREGEKRTVGVGERGNGKREKGKEKEMKRRKKRGSSLCCSVCERHIGCDLLTISSMVSICSSVKRNWKETTTKMGAQHHNICQGTDPPASFPRFPAPEREYVGRVWE